jgi:hypothetical protein
VKTYGIVVKIGVTGQKTAGTETTAPIEAAPVLETILQALKVILAWA